MLVFHATLLSHSLHLPLSLLATTYITPANPYTTPLTPSPPTPSLITSHHITHITLILHTAPHPTTHTSTTHQPPTYAHTNASPPMPSAHLTYFSVVRLGTSRSPAPIAAPPTLPRLFSPRLQRQYTHTQPQPTISEHTACTSQEPSAIGSNPDLTTTTAHITHCPPAYLHSQQTS
jgi:hypothetical protein